MRKASCELQTPLHGAGVLHVQCQHCAGRGRVSGHSSWQKLYLHPWTLEPCARAQVFRTYNASIVLDALLHKESSAETVEEKKAEYDRANKEVRASARACS